MRGRDVVALEDAVGLVVPDGDAYREEAGDEDEDLAAPCYGEELV